MARRDCDQDKKRRRKKRLEKKRARNPAAEPLGQLLTDLKRQLSVLEPARWPGGCDPSLTRPDQVKLEFGMWATNLPPGNAKAAQMVQNLREGMLGFLPNLLDWAWEEFIWHGLPGDSWHPLDAFLEQAGNRFSPEAAQQLRLWKEARIGLYEIGEVEEETMALREWDGVTQTAGGPWFQAISLNIGGINYYRPASGHRMLTYAAPWQPSDNLFCAMGYGKMADGPNTAVFLPYLGLRHPEVVCRPLPWKANRAAVDHYARQWRYRELHGWLEARLHFPFLAWVGMPPEGRPQALQVDGLLPSTPEQAQSLGIYFDVVMPGGKESMAAGGTLVTPLDVTSPNRMALAEYHAYRELAGPPPGTRSLPAFVDMR